MIDVLLLRLEAPLMSFGAPMVDRRGVVQPYPALSLVTGLLANALGFDHQETRRLARLQDRVQYAIRCDRRGSLLADYQTVDLSQAFMQDDRAWTTLGRLEVRKGGTASSGTHERLRQFWADAAYTVALALDPRDESPTIDQVADALRRPARPLFIGRKVCLPSSPLLLSQGQADGLLEALSDPILAPPSAYADGSEDGRVFSAWWPSTPSDDRARPVTDARDWANQIHVGERWIAAGDLRLPDVHD